MLCVRAVPCIFLRARTRNYGAQQVVARPFHKSNRVRGPICVARNPIQEGAGVKGDRSVPRSCRASSCRAL